MDILTISYCIDALRISSDLKQAEEKLVAMMNASSAEQEAIYLAEKKQLQEKKMNGLLDRLMFIARKLEEEMDWEDVKKHPEYLAIKQEIADAKKLEEE